MIAERMLRLLPAAANDDGEFALAARMWTSDVVFAGDAAAARMRVRDGRITEVSPAATNDAAPIRIVGADDAWQKMLLPHPPPFYHDLFGAAVHHGFLILGPIEDVYAYYPALRRLIELMRADGGA